MDGGTQELERLTPLEAAELGSRSLRAYGRLFFPRTFRQASPSYHDDMGAALYGPSRFVAFEVFRDGAKTSLLRTFTSQRVAYGISRTIMYVSISQPHSLFSVRWLRRQVDYNTRWAQTFSLRRGDKWTDEVAEIYHGVEETPITVLAMGITGQIRGYNPDDYRPDLIIIDDVLNEENTATPEQRKKIELLLFGALLNSLAPASECPTAKAAFLQTPMHREDAIEKCMNDPEWFGVRIGCFNEKGESRWPERYPTEVLLKAKEAHIRRGQYRLWMREKECTLVSGEEKAIDVTKFKHYDLRPENMNCILAIDPASSDSPDADHMAICVLGFRDLDVYLLDYRLEKASMPDAIANHFFNFILWYQPRKAVVETVSYQRVLKWYLEQEMKKRRIFLAIDPVQDKRSKATRIMQAIPGLVHYGHFFIRPSHTELITQADDYDPQVDDQPDDLLDAIAMGIMAVNPALRAANVVEGEYNVVDDESDYKPLRIGGCP